MFLRKISKLFFVTALVLAICASTAFAQAQEKPGERIALTVGDEKFKETEIMNIIIDSMSGNDMMTMLMLSQSTLEERREIANDISEVLLFAEGAKAAGLHMLPATAFQIKWQVAQILLRAYFENATSKWDFSDAAIQKYYNQHKSDFVQREAVSAAQILIDTESDAIMAALEARDENGFVAAAEIYGKRPLGDLGWVEKGMMPPEVEEAIMNGRPGQVVGPVQSEGGWLVILIGERRPTRQLTLEEAKNTVIETMETHYIEAELVKLREKHPVKIDDEVISTLGGIPAPSPVIAE